MIRSILRRFHNEPAPEPKHDRQQDNTHGWIKCPEWETADGYTEIGLFDPDLLISAATRFVKGYPACVAARVSHHNGVLLITPVDGNGTYMVLPPQEVIDE